MNKSRFNVTNFFYSFEAGLLNKINHKLNFLKTPAAPNQDEIFFFINLEVVHLGIFDVGYNSSYLFTISLLVSIPNELSLT